MNELALFAGAGGGILGTKLLGWRTVCYVEWEPYCIEIIKARIKDGIFDDAPIWDDVRTFDGHPWAGSVDIITAGFPCQPFSVAGNQLAENDERNMWPETRRIISEVQPGSVFLENVPGLISSGYIITVINDLREIGYQVLPPLRLSAGDIGACHKRERIWILAYAEHGGMAQRRGIINAFQKGNKSGGIQGVVAQSSEQQKRKVVANSNQQHDDNSGPGTSEISEQQTTVVQGMLSDTSITGLERKESKRFGGRKQRLSSECDWK